MDIKNALTKEYEVKSYEVNCNNQLKPSNLLHLLEDVAYQSAEELGFGYSEVYLNGLAWFVVKYRLELLHLPCAWENIKIKTWPILSRGVTCRRDFEVYKDDKIITRASSLWAVVDMNTKRLLNPFKTLNFPELDETHALETDYSKIETLDNYDLEKEITIRFDDIDLNGHVNNSNYISWAQDIFDDDFLKSHSPKGIEIDYKKEATKEDKIICSCAKYFEEENKSLHVLKKQDGTEVAQIKIYWE